MGHRWHRLLRHPTFSKYTFNALLIIAQRVATTPTTVSHRQRKLRHTLTFKWQKVSRGKSHRPVGTLRHRAGERRPSKRTTSPLPADGSGEMPFDRARPIKREAVFVALPPARLSAVKSENLGVKLATVRYLFHCRDPRWTIAAPVHRIDSRNCESSRGRKPDAAIEFLGCVLLDEQLVSSDGGELN